jgi:hypothetical protein
MPARCGHLADQAPPGDDSTVSVPEPEQLISREEVVGTMFTLADIASDVAVIRHLLGER